MQQLQTLQDIGADSSRSSTLHDTGDTGADSPRSSTPQDTGADSSRSSALHDTGADRSRSSTLVVRSRWADLLSEDEQAEAEPTPPIAETRRPAKSRARKQREKLASAAFSSHDCGCGCQCEHWRDTGLYSRADTSLRTALAAASWPRVVRFAGFADRGDAFKALRSAPRSAIKQLIAEDGGTFCEVATTTELAKTLDWRINLLLQWSRLIEKMLADLVTGADSPRSLALQDTGADSSRSSTLHDTGADSPCSSTLQDTGADSSRCSMLHDTGADKSRSPMLQDTVHAPKASAKKAPKARGARRRN